MSHPVPTVGVVCLRGEEVLLIKRGTPPRLGQWSVPGGRLEWGETLQGAALRELISTWKTCRRWNRGDMRLAEVNPNIRKVLDLTGLSGQFMIFDTEAEAVGSF